MRKRRRMRVSNASRKQVLGETVREARSLFCRMKGLLGTDGFSPGDGLWICPCKSIHSFGMRFVFDALFLGPDLKVLGKYERFRRNSISRVFWNARGVLELPAGTIGRTGTKVGDEIVFQM
jgi:hypothetical protein